MTAPRFRSVSGNPAAGFKTKLFVGAWALAVAGGCTSSTTAESDVTQTVAVSAPAEAASPTTAIEAPIVTSLRDNDLTDVDELAAAISAGADGDREWIEVFAELRARSWLANRYPGEYDIDTIYSDDWAAETAEPNESEWLELGVYLDEPLPRLISVIETRQIGALTELEVVVDVDVAVVRLASDDSLQSEFPGGRARGLYTVAQDGPADQWRIHSVVELRILADPNAEESNP